MLTPTFAPDLAYLFSRMPADRQTCLFTATESDAIRTLEEKEPRPGKEKIFVHKVITEYVTNSLLPALFLVEHTCRLTCILPCPLQHNDRQHAQAALPIYPLPHP
jgi:hypothetical protein